MCVFVSNSNYVEYQRSYYIIGIFPLQSLLFIVVVFPWHIHTHSGSDPCAEKYLILILTLTFAATSDAFKSYYAKHKRFHHFLTRLKPQSQHPQPKLQDLSFLVFLVCSPVFLLAWASECRGSLQVARLFGGRWAMVCLRPIFNSDVSQFCGGEKTRDLRYKIDA